MRTSCSHEDFRLLGEPHSEDGGEFLLAPAECEECGVRLQAMYVIDTSQSDAGRFDERSMDTDVRAGGEEIRVWFTVGSETRYKIYELDALDEVSHADGET